MWCSRANLLERKTSLICQECGKGFCRDERNRLSCWSHYIALGGVPKALKDGTRKRWINECIINGGGTLDELVIRWSHQLAESFRSFSATASVTKERWTPPLWGRIHNCCICSTYRRWCPSLYKLNLSLQIKSKLIICIRLNLLLFPLYNIEPSKVNQKHTTIIYSES